MQRARQLAGSPHSRRRSFSAIGRPVGSIPRPPGPDTPGIPARLPAGAAGFRTGSRQEAEGDTACLSGGTSHQAGEPSGTAGQKVDDSERREEPVSKSIERSSTAGGSRR